MPSLSPKALTRVETVRDLVGATAAQNNRITRLINAVSDAMTREAGRLFHFQADIVESVSGFGGFRLLVSRRPLLLISSIDVLDVEGNVVSTFDDTTYKILGDGGAGIIHSDVRWLDSAMMGAGIVPKIEAGTERDNVQVTYDGGWVTPEQEALTANDPQPLVRSLPEELEEACLASVTNLWTRSGNSLAVQSASEETTQVTFGKMKGLLLMETCDVLKRYRSF